MPFENLVKSCSKTSVPTEYDSAGGQLLFLDEATEKESRDFQYTNLLIRQGWTDIDSVLTSDLREFIAFEFSLTPEVEYVYTAFRENQVFYAWVIIDSFEGEVRDQIYDRQQAIIDEFPGFEFDFYIVARMGRDVEDLFDDSVKLTYQKRQM